jgi:hypothetical protein
MLPFIALIKKKFEFYPMKKAGLHGRINLENLHGYRSASLHVSSSIRAQIASNDIRCAR